MITSVPCLTDKMTLETAKRIVNIMREKRGCRLGGPSSILCYLEVHWSSPSETVPLGFASAGDLLDKHSYTGLNPDPVAPNSHTWLARVF